MNVVIDGEAIDRRTGSDGWLKVTYRDGQKASYTIHNPYDGTIVEGLL